MAGQSGIDEVVKLFMHGANSVHFPRAIQDSLTDAIKNSDSSDNMADNIAKWRDNTLKQSDLSSQAREFLESPITILRMKAVPKIQEVSLDLDRAINSNTNEIKVEQYISKLSDSTSLSKGDLDAIREAFDESLKIREDAIKKIMAEDTAAPRQHVLDQWAKQFEGNEGAGASATRSGYASRWTNMTLGARGYDALKQFSDSLKESSSPFVRAAGHSASFTAEGMLHAKWAVPASLITIFAAHKMTDGESTEILTNASITALDNTADALEYVSVDLANTVRAVGPEAAREVIEIMSLPSQALSTAIEVGAERSGHPIESRYATAAAQAVTGDWLFAALPVLTGKDLSEEDLANIAVEAYRSGDVTKYFSEKLGISRDEAESLRTELGNQFDGSLNSYADKIGISQDSGTVSAFDSARKGAKEKKEELENAANRFINGNLTGGGLTAGLSGLFSKNASSVFNAASDNLDKLGVTGASKMAFQFISTVASIVGIFSKEAKESIQDFALSAFGIDEKIASLKEASSNGRVVSQFGDKFGVGSHKIATPELAAEL